MVLGAKGKKAASANLPLQMTPSTAGALSPLHVDTGDTVVIRTRGHWKEWGSTWVGMVGVKIVRPISLTYTKD